MNPDLSRDALLTLTDLAAADRHEAATCYAMARAVRACEGKIWLLPARTLTLARIHANSHDPAFGQWLATAMDQTGIHPTLKAA